MSLTYHETPVGWVYLRANDKGLTSCLFENAKGSLKDNNEGDKKEGSIFLSQAKEELNAYFSGNLKQFTVPLAPSGTSFQEDVWAALYDVPYGKTVSYQKIAQSIGRPRAARAVGNACGENPLAIFIPCHRIIHATGKMTGYKWGFSIKKTLLDLEQKR